VGAGEEGHTYQFNDPVRDLPMGDRIYYRIRSIDQEGLEALSPVVEATVVSELSLHLSVKPNPSQQGSQGNVVFYADAEGAAAYQILDMAGRVLHESGWNVQGGLNVLPLPSEKLVSGMYLIRLQIGTKSAICKWIIE
jgi:hypothetical protein